MTESDILLLYQPLIESTARRFSYSRAIADDLSLQLDDLIQEAYICLLNAVRKSKAVSLGCCNTPYFTQCVNAGMIDFVRRVASLRRGGRMDDQVKTVSLDEAMHIPAFDLINDYETKQTVQQIISETLEVRDAEMVMMYFGIGKEGNEGMTQQEIADEFGVTTQRVSRIIQRSLMNVELVQRLREALL